MLVAGSLAACDNKGAYVGGVNGTLAVGAYHTLAYGDACSGGGKLNFCTSETITEILDLRSEDPTVLEIVPGTSHPRAGQAKRPFYALGKKPGQASLTFKARFDDGSVRADSAQVMVKSADLAKLVYACRGEDRNEVLASVGSVQDFEVHLYAGGERLTGWLPDAIAADGVTDVFADMDVNRYSWQAPSVPATQTLRAGAVSRVTGKLTAFGPAQVSSIDIVSRNAGSPAAFAATGQRFYVDTQIRVNGQVPCENTPVELHALTPAVCAGPAGALAWMGDRWGGEATVYAEGSCGIGAALPGGAIFGTKSFPIFFVQSAPTGLKIPGYGEACPTEGGTACAYGYSSVGVCTEGRWVSKTSCSAQQTCDYVPETAPGCVSGASCAACRGLR